MIGRRSRGLSCLPAPIKISSGATYTLSCQVGRCLLLGEAFGATAKCPVTFCGPFTLAFGLAPTQMTRRNALGRRKRACERERARVRPTARRTAPIWKVLGGFAPLFEILIQPGGPNRPTRRQINCPHGHDHQIVQFNSVSDPPLSDQSNSDLLRNLSTEESCVHQPAAISAHTSGTQTRRRGTVHLPTTPNGDQTKWSRHLACR